MNPAPRRAPCPQCNEPAVLGTSNPWRPFCSERCKLVDLNGWFSGRYAVPGGNPLLPPDEDPD